MRPCDTCWHGRIRTCAITVSHVSMVLYLLCMTYMNSINHLICTYKNMLDMFKHDILVRVNTYKILKNI